MSHANSLRVSPYLSLYSTKLTGTDESLDADGKLVSNSNLFTGLKISYALTGSFHLLLDYNSGTVKYDNTQEVISGEEKYTKTKIGVGARLIIHPMVGFRLMYNTDKEIGFAIAEDDENKALIKSESINYLAAYYDQIIFMGSSGMYSGFFLGHEISAASKTYFSRTANEYGLFLVLSNLRVAYALRSLTKESDDLKFKESSSFLEVSYTLSF